MDFFLLAFPALFSIINPLGGAFVFLSATRKLPERMRDHLARWVAIHSFLILTEGRIRWGERETPSPLMGEGWGEGERYATEPFSATDPPTALRPLRSAA